jgi:hypothetical protein
MNESRNGDFDSPVNHEPPNGKSPISTSGVQPTGDSSGESLDPFDPERLRLAQDLTTATGVREVLLTVKFGRPSKESFFRVHPSVDYRIKGGIVELKEDDSATYWVDPALWPAMTDQPTFSPRAVFTAITRQGMLFLWGCRLPGPDGKSPDWVSIPLEAAKLAETQWTKIFWDQNQRKHRVLTAPALTDEPVWPETPFRKLLQLAFKDRVITSLDHPVLKRLRGEM